MRTNQERLEAILQTEIKTIQAKMGANQEKMDDGQEEMKAQVGSLTSQINGKQE
jgi:hypothetical protein